MELLTSLRKTSKDVVKEVAEKNKFKESEFKIYESYAYYLFKFKNTNRAIREDHVRKIKNSILKDGYLVSPIIVDQMLAVIEGQHRLTALMQLNEAGQPYPIRFIICPMYGDKQMITYNTNFQKWNKDEYLRHYCEIGIESYIVFAKFMNDFPWLSQTAAEVIFTNSHDGINKNRTLFDNSTRFITAVKYKETEHIVTRSDDFQSGLLEMPKNIDAIYEKARQVKMFSDFYDGYYRSSFIRTLITLFKNNNFEFTRLIKKLKGKGGDKYKLRDCGNVETYLEIINLIYNFGEKTHYLELRSPKK